jgi:hypothetical protein
MTNSRAKGARGELELAQFFRSVYGICARRGQQFAGGPDSPDIITDLPGVHIECKRVESFALYPALAQATRDASADDIPVVFHRKNKHDWVAVIPARLLPRFSKTFLEAYNNGTIQSITDEKN